MILREEKREKASSSSKSTKKKNRKKKLSKPDLKLDDLRGLQALLIEMCKEYGVDPDQHPFVKYWEQCLKETPDRPKAVFKMMSHPIATFSLLTGYRKSCTIHVPGMGDFNRDLRLRPIIKPAFLETAESQMKCSRAGACKLPNSVYRPASERASEDGAKCKLYRKQQDDFHVTVKPRNLCSILGWVDSALLDCFMGGLQRSFPESHRLFILSAEEDPSMEVLRDIEGCYDYVLMVLYRGNHWTCMFINYNCREITYYNSQRNENTVYKQLEPYRHHFADFSIQVADVPQQSDDISCGIFVCWYSYCILYCPESIHALSCTKSEEMRLAVIRQVLLWYVL